MRSPARMLEAEPPLMRYEAEPRNEQSLPRNEHTLSVAYITSFICVNAGINFGKHITHIRRFGFHNRVSLMLMIGKCRNMRMMRRVVITKYQIFARILIMKFVINTIDSPSCRTGFATPSAMFCQSPAA